MTQKVALVTGVTGQDGSYLSELLLSKGYVVHGVKRRASMLRKERIEHLYQDAFEVEEPNFILHYGDLSDGLNLSRLVHEIQPDEVYNLAAQSHVAVSFEQPEYTVNTDGLGALRLLEATRQLSLHKEIKYYQASTSELYGKVLEIPQSESTPFYPRSPYACAKLYAYWMTVNYREAYGLHASNGILFNHESPRRGETFVTRKITRGLARIIVGLDSKLVLGNVDALRDWGHAKDFVEAQWLMLQQDQPGDYVIATGEQHSVREFIEICCIKLGMQFEWRGVGVETVGVWLNAPRGARPIIFISPKYFRPTEVDTLLGDSSKARSKLNWSPKISFEDLVSEMVAFDLKSVEQT